MTDQETILANAFVSTLSAQMDPTDLTANVVSIGSLTTPCYLVIDMEDDAKREYILFDGTFGATSFVATNINKRYLAGSAAASNLTHLIGANVQSVAAQQHFEDLNDRIDADAAVVAALNHADLDALGADDHSQYHTDARGDARYLKLADVAHQFVLVWSGGRGEAEVEDTPANAFRWKAPFACTMLSATPTCGVAPTGDSLDWEGTIDGTTAFSGTKPSVAAGSKDGSAQAPSSGAVASGEVVTFYISQIGSTLPGENAAIAVLFEVP